MKLLPTLVLVTALGLGAAGAATAYRIAAPDVPAASARTAVVVPAAPPGAGRPARPATVFRWAPCPRGTTLHGKTCVRTVIHQVTRSVPVPAPAPAPFPAAAPVPAAAHSSPHPVAHPAGDGGGQHEHEHEHEGGGGGEHDD